MLYYCSVLTWNVGEDPMVRVAGAAGWPSDCSHQSVARSDQRSPGVSLTSVKDTHINQHYTSSNKYTDTLL